MSKYYDSDSSSSDRDHASKHTDYYYDEYEYDGNYYEQKKPQNEKEANRVMERAKDKKFWNCDDVDNFNSLKGAIDLLYNKVPGNVYAVKYQENQNGTRLTIVCETCDKTLSSYDPFLSHENGKNHKKARQQKLTPPDPNINKKPKNRRINLPKDIFYEDSLEEMIDHSRRTTIGVHFIYREVIDDTELFTCTLCTRTSSCERLKRDKMFQHITSKDHMRNYLEIKYGFKKVISIEEEAKHIEELEGKIHHKITDFTNQLETDEKYSKRYYKDFKFKKEKSSTSTGSSSDSSRSSSTSRKRKSKHKHKKSKRRYSPSPSRSIKRSPSSRRYSPSPSRSIKRSPSSRRYSPSPSYRSRRSRSHSPVSSRARSPVRAQTPPRRKQADACVRVDNYDLEGHTITEHCKNLVDNNVKDEYISVISENQDMQNLIIHALYVLNNKVETYYKENGIQYNDGQRVGLIAEKSEDVHNMICRLTALSTDAEE